MYCMCKNYHNNFFINFRVLKLVKFSFKFKETLQFTTLQLYQMLLEYLGILYIYIYIYIYIIIKHW